MKKTIISMSSIFLLTFVISSCILKKSDKPDAYTNLLNGKNKVSEEAINIIKGSEHVSDITSEDIVNHVIDDSDPEYKAETTDISKVIMSDIVKDTPSTEIKKKKRSANFSSTKRYLTIPEMKRALEKGRYTYILKNKIDKTSLIAKYYLATANYCQAKQSSKRLKSKYAATASKLFKEVGVASKNKEFKAKSILWHGVTLYKFKSKKTPLSIAMKPFSYIQKKLKYTKCYNDSLLTAGLVLLKYNKKDEASKYFNRLKKTHSKDPVYDVDYLKWVRPNIAAEHYLRTLTSSTKTKNKKENTVEAQQEFLKKLNKLHQDIIEETTEEIKETPKQEDVSFNDSTNSSTDKTLNSEETQNNDSKKSEENNIEDIQEESTSTTNENINDNSLLDEEISSNIEETNASTSVTNQSQETENTTNKETNNELEDLF